MLLEILVPLFLPPVNDEFEDACLWQDEDVPCASTILPSGYDVTLAVPGATFSISDFDGSPSRTDVTFTQTVTITDELLTPGAGVLTYTPVCLNLENEPVSIAGARSLQQWSDDEPGFQSLADWAAEGPAEFALGVSELCAPSQTRGILAYATWAPSIWTPGFNMELDPLAGWIANFPVDGDIVNMFCAANPACVELEVLQSPNWGEDGQVIVEVQWVGDFYGSTFGSYTANTSALALRASPLSSLASGHQQLGTYAGWGGVSVSGYPTRLIVFNVIDMDCLVFTVVGVTPTCEDAYTSDRGWFPPGHPGNPADGEYEGLGAASITRSDALDSVRFVPDPVRSNLLTIEGMCLEWEDCAAMCDGYGLDVTGWFGCFFGFGDLQLDEVWSALMSDFMESPLIAQIRVAYSNMERALVAIENVSNVCGVLGEIDSGMIGSITLNTCDMPADFRSNARLAGAFMVAVAGCFLVARNIMIGLGMPFIGYGGNGEEKPDAGHGLKGYLGIRK